MLKHAAEQCADPFKWRLCSCGVERCHCGAEAMGRCDHGCGHLAVQPAACPCSRLYTKAVGHDTTAVDVSFVKVPDLPRSKALWAPCVRQTRVTWSVASIGETAPGQMGT